MDTTLLIITIMMFTLYIWIAVGFSIITDDVKIIKRRIRKLKNTMGEK